MNLINKSSFYHTMAIILGSVCFILAIFLSSVDPHKPSHVLPVIIVSLILITTNIGLFMTAKKREKHSKIIKHILKKKSSGESESPGEEENLEDEAKIYNYIYK